MPADDHDWRLQGQDQRQTSRRRAGREIGWRFWMLWMMVLAAWNAWMGFAVHPHTNAYNGYDVLTWVVGNAALVILMIVNACVVVTVLDRRRRRSSAPRLP
jgi:hypothetical protein